MKGQDLRSFFDGNARLKQINREDSTLRETFREAAASQQQIDVWPNVCTSIRAAPARRPVPFLPRAWQWTWRAAVATVVIAACGLLHPALTTPRTALPTVTSAPEQPTRDVSLGLAVDTLADVPQVNPAVDDPARSSVEQIWIQLGNRPASEAESQ